MYPSAAPAKRKEYRDRYERRHPGAHTVYARDWNRRRKYGVTTAEWEAIFDTQGRRCAVCRSGDPGGAYWHTDHKGSLPCTKDDIRGILCLHCNHAIGHGTADDLARQHARAAYLEKWLCV